MNIHTKKFWSAGLIVLLLVYCFAPWKAIFTMNSINIAGKISVNEQIAMDFTTDTRLEISTFPTKTMLLGTMVFPEDTWTFSPSVMVGETKENGATLLKNGALTGFIQSVKFGLIKLSATDDGTTTLPSSQSDSDWGVYKTGNTLNGYAWNDSIGWICFGSCIQNNAQLQIVDEQHSQTMAYMSLLYNLRYEAATPILIILFIVLLSEYKYLQLFVPTFLLQKKPDIKPPKSR